MIRLELESTLGTPTGLLFSEITGHPPRVGVVSGVDAADEIEVRLAGKPLLKGAIWRTRTPRKYRVQSLPAWRRMVGPQGFSDVTAATVLRWIANTCGGEARIAYDTNIRRHYQLARQPALQAVRAVVAAWGLLDGVHELDGGGLYIGPPNKSPHWTVTHQVGPEVLAVRRSSLVTLICAPLPELRVGHRLEIDHPEYQGRVRVVEHILYLEPNRAEHHIYGSPL